MKEEELSHIANEVKGLMDKSGANRAFDILWRLMGTGTFMIAIWIVTEVIELKVQVSTQLSQDKQTEQVLNQLQAENLHWRNYQSINDQKVTALEVQMEQWQKRTLINPQ